MSSVWPSGRASADPYRARGASCARNILDNDLLAEGRRHRLTDQARDDVGRAAGGVGHNEGDRARGILSLRPREDAQTDEGEEGRKNAPHVNSIHPLRGSSSPSRGMLR